MPLAMASRRRTRALSPAMSTVGAARRPPPVTSSRFTSSQPRQALSAARLTRVQAATPAAANSKRGEMSPILSVPQPLDVAFEAVFLLHRDPLQHRQPVAQRFHFPAQALVLAVAAEALVLEVGHDPRAERGDENDAEDEFEHVHARVLLNSW